MKDYIKFIILILIYIHYLNIIFSYFIFSLFLIFIILKNLCKGKSVRKILNLYFNKRPKIPNVNLFSHIINPFIAKYYIDENDNIYEEEEESCYFENFYFETMIIIKLIIIVFSTYCFIIFFINYLNF